MRELLPEGLRQRRKQSNHDTDEEYVQNVLFEGDDLTLPFVAQHLTDNITGVSCETESQNTASEPDIVVSKNGVEKAKLEVKRTVSSGNVSDYVTQFTAKEWHEGEKSTPSVLVIYFPLICETPAWRAQKLVRGYQSLIEREPKWNEDWMYVRTIPAPLESGGQFGPLETTENLVREL